MAILGKILIVDDDTDVLLSLKMLLTPYAEQLKTTNRPEMLGSLMKSFAPDIVLLDMNFQRDAVSGAEGFAYLDQIRQIDPDVVVVFMTAFVDVNNAVKAIKQGVFDYVTKPWDNAELISTLSAAWQMRMVRQENTRLQSHLAAIVNLEKSGQVMIGQSEPMLEVQRIISQVALGDPPVLILGESGTGKDVAAQLLWQQSSRSSAPFIRIDLSAIPESLFESELFGYEKGAFTDARTSKPGRFELADGGTLFLDEIGNLSIPMQAKLLTAIEKKEIVRLGGKKTIKVDARIITATNEDIDALVAAGRFRQDLLYRINTIEIQMPPLRDRGEDIMLLAEYFRQRAVNLYHKQVSGFTRNARRKLLSYRWPGNVRELQHVIDRAVLLSNGPLLSEDLFVLKIRKEMAAESLDLQDVEQQTIKKALQQTNNNLSRAAELLGISRFSLYRKLKDQKEKQE